MQDQKSRESIVQRMIDAGESEENIASVIRHFKAIEPAAPTGGESPSVGRQAWNAVKTFASDMNPLPMVGQAIRFGMNPTGEAQRIGAASLDESINRSGKAKQAFAEGNIGGGVADALGAIPVVGGVVSSVSDPIRKGDYGTAAGHVASMALGPKVIKGLGKAAKSGATATMESALRINAPIARKYGRSELGRAALDSGILPTQKGADKAGAVLGRMKADKENLLRDAGNRVTMNPQAIAGDAASGVAPAVAEEFLAGLRPKADVPQVIRRFSQRTQGGGIAPHVLDSIKSKWDDAQEATQIAKRMGKRPTADADAVGRLAKSSGEALSQAAPGYAAANKEIRTMAGVRKAAQGRADVPARGLDNLAAAYAPSKWTALMRLARSPQIMGAGALGADKLGNFAMQNSEAVRAAILANLMASHRDR